MSRLDCADCGGDGLRCVNDRGHDHSAGHGCLDAPCETCGGSGRVDEVGGADGMIGLMDGPEMMRAEVLS